MFCTSRDIINPSEHIFMHLHSHRCNNYTKKLQQMVGNINNIDIEHQEIQYISGYYCKRLYEMLELSLVYKKEDK